MTTQTRTLGIRARYFLSNVFSHKNPALNSLINFCYRTNESLDFLYRKLSSFHRFYFFRAFFALLYFFLAWVMTRSGKYREAIDQFRKTISINPTEPRYQLFFARLLIQIGNFDDARSYLENALNLCQAKSQKSSRTLVEYASLLAHIGESIKAEQLYDQVAADQPELINQYLGLAAKIGSKRPATQSQILAYKKIHSRIMNSQARLEKLIRKNRNSLCIVGNAPSELGKGLGSFIDSHKVVIRFNNFSTADVFRDDYGSKTTIWVRTPGDTVVHPRSVSAYDHIIYTGPVDTNVQRYNYWDTIKEYHDAGVDVSFIDNTVWYDLIRRLDSPPSSGLAVVAMLYKILGPIKKENVLGFSFTDEHAPSTVSSHYFEKSRASIRHNWKKERELFDQFFI